ncbi:hypothetical protein QFC21_003201 [Naganishia friedmannii]|uniref:Uncharacterized protein n=1 Tax=Naganishia friedmannii TaxID=89922 RepID=A0ACC2VT96_9TREE|nr:hypothetical protein QFC21_003201 [Naganishia friedmannii]
MPATRTNLSSALDLSRASPITNNPTTANNLSNDPGSTTLGTGVGAGGKTKLQQRQPLKRSASSAAAQSLLGFSSRKAGPVTPEKKKKTTAAGLKRRIEQVVDVDVDEQQEEEDASTNGSKITTNSTAMHPVFAVPDPERNTAAASSLQPTPATSTTHTIEGTSAVPQNGAWDPLLLFASASASGPGKPTKQMEENLAPAPSRDITDLEPTPEEQVEEIVVVVDQADDAGKEVGRTIRGLAVRKAMLRADEKIRVLRHQRPSTSSSNSASAKSKTAAAAAGKGKQGAAKSKKEKSAGKADGGLDPNDKRWDGVYRAAWELMGGADVAPIHTTPQTHTKIHHVLRVFDLSPQYGPCVGLTRLARWERAQQWGLEPPVEIREILETVEGASEAGYRETVFDGTGIYCPTA